MKTIVKGYAYAILSAVIFGCSPLAAKYAYQHGLNPFMLTFFRNALTLPVFYLILKRSGEPIALSARDRKSILSIAFFSGCLTQTLLFTSYIFIPTGVATVFHYVYPAIVIVCSFLCFRQKVYPAKIIGLILCTVGVFALCATPERLDPLGCALALLSGVTYAVYILLLEHRRPAGASNFKISFYIALMVTGVMLVINVAAGTLALPTSVGCWLVCLVYALLSSVVGIVWFQKGTELIGGQRASILSAFEPITSIVVGVLVFREAFSWKYAVGAFLIIAAAVVIALSDVRRTECSE